MNRRSCLTGFTGGTAPGHRKAGDTGSGFPRRRRSWRIVKERSARNTGEIPELYLRSGSNAEKDVEMEPFVNMGGQVGQDIKVWRPLCGEITEEQLDQDAKDAVRFQRYMLDGVMD